MPSDERLALVLEALDAPHAAFRAALGTTADQLAHYLTEHRRGGDGPDRVTQMAQELGPFASERIDARKFSSLFAPPSPAASVNGRALDAIEHARATLADMAARGQSLVHVDVPAGGDLISGVARGLEGIGRAFSAVRAFEAARHGGQGSDGGQGRTTRTAVETPPSPSPSPSPLDVFPFSRWGQAERRRCPPLVVTLGGADLGAGAAGLAPFLDGAVKLVLLVEGEAPPAPLVRAITPGTFVLQSPDIEPERLARMIAWDGPGIAAFLSATAAQFIHDPSGGPALGHRLTVSHLPEEAPSRALGGVSARQQADELRQLAELAALATAPSPAVESGEPALAGPAPALSSSPLPPVDPVDKLAAWLLSQADLGDLG